MQKATKKCLLCFLSPPPGCEYSRPVRRVQTSVPELSEVQPVLPWLLEVIHNREPEGKGLDRAGPEQANSGLDTAHNACLALERRIGSAQDFAGERGPERAFPRLR
jgi:hypothetical protein